jgi:hypothetical protein
MKYTVVWLKSAEAKLASIWNEAADRNAVTQASHSIDAQLAMDPQNCGESRPENLRVYFVPPLAVTFSIQADDRIVRVADVWRSRRR